MKTVLYLSVLLCAALAAPAEVEEKFTDMPVESNQPPAVVAEEKLAAAPVKEMLSEDNSGSPDGAEKEENMLAEDEDEGSDPAFKNAYFCPDGWFSHGYRCYLFVNSPMNWNSAKDHCNRLHANLTSVGSPREYRFLQQMTKMGGHSTAWLGGFYQQGRWQWINNEGFYYTNWYSQSPATNYPCIFLYSNNGWSNRQCSFSLRFICSKILFNN